MTTEQEIKDIITKKGRIHAQQIAKIVGISTNYTSFICQVLQRKGEIDYSRGWASVKGFKEEKVGKIKVSREAIKVSRKKEKSRKKKINRFGPFDKLRASKLTTRKKKFRPITDLKKVTPELAKKLKKIGYKTIEDIAEAPLAMLMQRVKISLKQAAEIINEARRKLRKIKV